MSVRSAGSSRPGSEDLSRLAELASEAGNQVARQHVVSQVLLRQFATPVRHASGLQVQPYDLLYPERHCRTKPTRAVGWIKDFVPYASASLEALWAEVEQKLPPVFHAVPQGTALGDPHALAVLRDLIALHYVRSQHYRDTFHRIFKEAHAEQRRWLLAEGQQLLRAATLQRTGLDTPGRQALAVRADELLSTMVESYGNGSLLRVRIEDSFRTAREWVAGVGLEILQAEEGEFLIGDNPAMTLRTEDEQLIYGMALGDAHTAVLPLGPRHTLALGAADGAGSVPRAWVDRMNVLQVKTARRRVFTRPGSPLRRFIGQLIPQWQADQSATRLSP
ncbi:DUF4238 domain-containing protein [Streptomyces lunaelactis]|nr:DUF4238 domain-containing protein [Streptomyces lunaelactis]NUK86281.1 DUF4238 domain-containing protein [Streptomyces lunaelactis]